MHDAASKRWLDLLSAWSVAEDRSRSSFDEISVHYSQPHRHYHTIKHIEFMLETIDDLAHAARHPNLVRLAAWLHDVIYDSKASDNEERSAEFAVRICGELGIPVGDRVAALILKTKTHDAKDDADAHVLLDADLAILGQPQPIYQSYAEQIRREFAWVTDAEYRNGRTKVLTSFLRRPRIYHLLTHLEESARRNLAHEIAALTSPTASFS